MRNAYGDILGGTGTWTQYARMQKQERIEPEAAISFQCFGRCTQGFFNTIWTQEAMRGPNAAMCVSHM